MHEFAIASSIVELVVDRLIQDGIKKKVQRVNLKYGQLNQIIPESLRFNFDLLKAEHSQLAEADLTLVMEPLEVHCAICEKSFTLTEANFICSRCDSPLQVVAGDDIRVESIDVED